MTLQLGSLVESYFEEELQGWSAYQIESYMREKILHALGCKSLLSDDNWPKYDYEISYTCPLNKDAKFQVWINKNDQEGNFYSSTTSYVTLCSYRVREVLICQMEYG